MTSFPRLFSPIRLRNTEIRNRILSTGHQTYLAKGGLPGEDFVAYHEARAKGGAGLIVVEAARFHATGFTDSPELIVASDDCIPGLEKPRRQRPSAWCENLRPDLAFRAGDETALGRSARRRLRALGRSRPTLPHHAARDVGGADRGDHRRSGQGRTALRRGGLRRHRTAGEPRAPDLGLPQSPQQPAHRRLRRQLREPAALPQQPPRRGPQRPG